MRRIAVLSIGNLFASAHFFLIIYILAPYLATLMPAAVSGLAVSLGAFFTLSIFPFLPRLVKRYGPQRLGVFLGGLEMLVLLALAAGPGPVLAVLLAGIACATSPFIAYQLDLLVQAASTGGYTGRIRGAFLTAGNVALVLSPLVTGLLLDDTDRYGLVFLVAALSLIPFIYLMVRDGLPEHELPERTDMRESCLCIARDPDLRAIALAYGVMELFFHLAPLYVPLYLHSALGFPWSELGPLFAIMVVPFILFEYPAGWLADTRLGDKRILAAGFVITGLSFAATGLIDRTTSLAAIAVVLVLSRVGASLIESMTEGHFFRRISANDANTISVFRMMRPLGALLAPIIGSILLSVAGYPFFFSATGLFIFLIGLLSALSIRDAIPANGTPERSARPFPLRGAPRERV